jgi:hypothetical protein
MLPSQPSFISLSEMEKLVGKALAICELYCFVPVLN